MISLSKRLKSPIGLFFGLVMLVLFFASSVSASPASDYDNWNGGNALPTGSSQYINISEDGGSGNFADAGGTYNYVSSEAWVKVYTKNPSLKGISIQFTDRGIGQERSCSGYNLLANEYRMSENGVSNAITALNDSQQFAISPNASGGSPPCNIYRNLRINSSSFTASGAPEHAGLYVALIKFTVAGTNCRQIGAGADACKTPSFRLQMDPGIADADAKLAIAGTSDVYYENNNSVTSGRPTKPVDASSYLFENGISIYPSMLQQTHSFQYSFKPPCTLSGGSAFRVNLVGLDKNSSAQTQYRIPNTSTVIPSGNNLQVRITRADGSTPSQSTFIDNDNQLSIEIGDDRFNTTYVLVVSGITGGNGIRVVLPFDSGSGKFSCPPPPSSGDLVGVCENYSPKELRPRDALFNGNATRYKIIAYSDPGRTNIVAEYPQGSVPLNNYLGTNIPAAPADNAQPWGAGFGFPGESIDGRRLFYRIGSYRDNGGAALNIESKDVDSSNKNLEFTFNCGSPPANWHVQHYRGNSGIVELGNTANYDFSFYERLNQFDAYTDSAMESNYDYYDPSQRGDPSANGGFAWAYNQAPNLTPIPRGGSKGIQFSTTVPTDTSALGKNYCERMWVNPSRVQNNNTVMGQTYSEHPSGDSSQCFLVVGGKTDIGVSADPPEVEPEEAANFSITISTPSYSGGGGYGGYDAGCGWVIYSLSSSNVRSANLSSGSCASRVTQTGSSGTPASYLVPSSTPAGTRICLEATLTVPNDAFYLNPVHRTETKCVPVVAKPYFKVYGGDISAGNGFDGVCLKNSSVLGWNKNTGPAYSGSGVQYAIYAQGIIKGVAAGQGLPVQNDFGYAPSRLAFANTGIGALVAGQYGGKMGAGSCTSDYYGGKPNDGTVKNWSDLADSNNDAYGFTRNFEADGPLVIYGKQDNGANEVAQGNNTKLYVDGDVYINSDIVAVNGATTFDEIPNFMLVARGNIYVGANVGSLYGTYVAQPKEDGTGGTIFSCAERGSNSFVYSAVADGEIFAKCTKQLKVTGSFVANMLELKRTNGSLYKDKGGNAFTGSGSTNAAEVFQYNPLMWTRQSITSKTDNIDDFDSISTLPPVL